MVKSKDCVEGTVCGVWGVVVMMLFGDGSVAQVLLSTGVKEAPGGMGFGGYQSISWG